jgi:ubiquinone/menaquinone biosynthesis C-methylase UbiE
MTISRAAWALLLLALGVPVRAAAAAPEPHNASQGTEHQGERAGHVGHAQSAEDVHRLHHDPAAYIAVLEDPERDKWQRPDRVIRALRVAEGQSVADIGAGSGYFALRLARQVGPKGRVRAVDISPDMLAHLEARARKAGLDNVQTVLAKPDDPMLPAGSVDLVFICDTWHHIEDRPRYLATLRPALKPGARVALVDFQDRELPVGPPRSMKLSRETVVSEFAKAGFRLAEERSFLPYQYFLVFEPR